MKPNQRYQDFLELQAIESDDCTLWPYARTRGHGTVRAGNQRVYTHRLSCTIAHGEPPTPKHVAAHSCRNKHCLNPRHLRWATHSENCHDSVLDGTSSAKLTPEDVRAVRRHPNANRETVARHYGVLPNTITAILDGRTWAWLQQTP